MLRDIAIVGDAAVGGAGVATITTQSPETVVGRIIAIGLIYQGSPPATTDVTVRTVAGHGPVQTILTITDAAADGWFYPRKPVEDNVGAGVEYANAYPIYEPFAVADRLEVVIAGANVGDSVDVVLIYED